VTALWLVVANKSPVLFLMGGGRSRDLRGDGAEGPKEWERVGSPAQYQCSKASPLSVAVFSRILGQRQPRRMGWRWRWGVRVRVWSQ
jgi:hypothetical protein